MTNRKKQKSLKNKIITRGIGILILISLFLSYSGIYTWRNVTDLVGITEPIYYTEGGETIVTFFDIGQGDAAYIRDGDIDIIIDTGDGSLINNIFAHLNDIDIEVIEYIFISHLDTDHVGGLDEIIDEYTVETIVFAYCPDEYLPSGKWYTNLLETIDEMGIATIVTTVGDIYTFDNGVIEVLGPEKEDIGSANESSSQLYYTSNGKSVLFTGDMTDDNEEALIESGLSINIDILKVAHHGSYTSTSEEFVEAVDPEIAVISVGASNSYGHPHEVVLETLNNYGVELYRTDIDGEVSFLLSPSGIEKIA